MKRMLRRYLIGIMIILFILISATPVLAAQNGVDKKTGKDGTTTADCPADNGQGNAYGAWEHNWKCRSPEAFSEVEGLTIDTRIIEGTPHWIFLAAGASEKQALLIFINNANVPEKQKNEWGQFLTKIWKEHPVRFDGSTGVPLLVPGNSMDTFSLTSAEDATFQKIERYIAEDMAQSSTGDADNIITPNFQNPNI